jgi:hypothetical protein
MDGRERPPLGCAKPLPNLAHARQTELDAARVHALLIIEPVVECFLARVVGH